MKLKTSLTDLHYIIGIHFGEIIVELVIEIIKKYRFEEKLRYFILDNVISNDLYVEIIFREI